MNKDFKVLLDRAIIGTKYNHPSFNMGYTIANAIADYIDGYLEKNKDKQDNFYNYFSVKHELYGIPLRYTLYEYGKQNNITIALKLFDHLFQFCHMSLYNNNLSDNNHRILANYYVKYLNIVRSIDSSVEAIPHIIENNRDLIINDLLPAFAKAMNVYVDKIDIEKTFNFASINNLELSKTGQSVLTNCNDLDIMDSFDGVLLNGKISVASNKGYKSRPHKKQEDAVLSIAKSEDCFMNVIADGAGGCANGAIASKTIVEALRSWYESIDINYLTSLTVEQVAALVNEQLSNINLYIQQNYNDAYSTVVIALTFNNQTLISNVGDSTAYSYDYSSDKLIELTTLDSYSKGLSYEDARHNPNNNKITEAIGFSDGLNVHHVSILNNGSRIILSSDGVTDLVSERNFKDFFKNKSSALTIVNKSVYDADVSAGFTKTEDNTSAIVIDLPKQKIQDSARRM